MDVIKLYLKDIKGYPLLTAEEEVTLANKIKKGNADARVKMIQCNLKLVVNIAKKYRHLGVAIMDLVEEGNLGLMKAVEKYDPKKGCRFSTYGGWWIKQYITRAIADQGKTVRIPVYMVEMISRWKRVTNRLAQELGRKPQLKEVAKEMNLPVKKINDMKKMVTKATSLETPVGDGGTGQFMDLIEDVTTPTAIDELTKVLRHERIADLLGKMDEREREILILRFGLKDGVNKTLGETAKYFGITRERVRQIEKATLKKLREYMVKEDKEGRDGKRDDRTN